MDGADGLGGSHEAVFCENFRGKVFGDGGAVDGEGVLNPLEHQAGGDAAVAEFLGQGVDSAELCLRLG